MNQVIDVRDKAIMPPFNIDNQISESRDRIVFKGYELSRGEDLVCRVWARTHSMRACREELLRVYKRKLSDRGLKKWFKYRTHLAPVIAMYEGWNLDKMTEEEWEGRVAGMARGDVKVNKTTPMMYKLIMDYKGWGKRREESGQFNAKNIQVNILQSDGRV